MLQGDSAHTPSNRAEFGVESGRVGRAVRGLLEEQGGNAAVGPSSPSPGARAMDAARREAFLRRQRGLLKEEAGRPRPEPPPPSQESRLSGSCKSLTDLWERQLNCPAAAAGHTGPAFRSPGQDMEGRRRSLQEQFRQQESCSQRVLDAEETHIRAGAVGNVKSLMEATAARAEEVAKYFVPPAAGGAGGNARGRFQAALQDLQGGGGTPKRVQRSKSCTSMQPLWDNLLNNAVPKEPKFIGGGGAAGLGQVSGAVSRLEAPEVRVRGGRYDDELEMVRASRSRRQLVDDSERVAGFDGQRGIRSTVVQRANMLPNQRTFNILLSYPQLTNLKRKPEALRILE